MAIVWTVTDEQGTAILRQRTDDDNAGHVVAGVLVLGTGLVRLTAEELRELATIATALADKAAQ